MRILLVNTLFPPDVVGGAERSIALLAHSLVDLGHEVAVCCTHDKDYLLEETVGGLRVFRLPNENIYWQFDRDYVPNSLQKLRWHLKNRRLLRTSRFVTAIIKAFRPDVVNTNNLAGLSVQIWRISRELRVPIVHTIRDYSLLCARATLFRNGQNCSKKCIDCKVITCGNARLSARVNGVIGISRYVVDEHRRALYFDGVPDAVVRNIADRLPTGHRDTKKAGSPLVFSFIGKLAQDKGIEILLDAVQLLPKHRWKLLVAGRGEVVYEMALKTRFNNPEISWEGFVDVQAIYDAADVVIIPSIWKEPLSRVLIDAAMRGKPVIVARSGGLTEIAKTAAVVKLYEPFDRNALAECMKDALNEPNTWGVTHSISGSAMQQFDAVAVARETVGFFRYILTSTKFN